MAEKAQDPKTASEVQPHPVNDDSVNGDGSAQAEDNASSFKQEGVARVEGITSAVPRKTLLILFALLWVVTLTDGLMESSTDALNSYVVSAYKQAPLVAAVSIISTVVGGVSKLTIAKIINIWGRMEGYCIMILLIVLGLIMTAASSNVETYAAAKVFLWVGHIGLGYIIDVILADVSTVKNRMILFGLNQTPTIITTFAGPAIGQAFYDQVTWRWCFGAFTIIIPVIAVPAFVTFFLADKKAKKVGYIKRQPSGRSPLQSIWHYVIEFDALGLLLITAGFALILLPLSLASSSADAWKTGYIIAMIVIGGVCLIAFVIWERFFASIQFLPFHYLKNRTILGACIAYMALFLSIYCWDIYFSQYLQVVNLQSITNASYVVSAYGLSSAFFYPFVGLALKFWGRPKYIGLVSVPMATLGTSLLIYFRQPGAYVGYLVMCQVINGCAGAIITATSQLAVMAEVPHNEVAAVLALWGLFGSIGASVGLAISGALWTNLFPAALMERLPAEAASDWAKYYASLPLQLQTEWGSPVRDALNLAYGDVQRKMVIAGASFMPLWFGSLIIWRNINTKKIAQTKGNVL